MDALEKKFKNLALYTQTKRQSNSLDFLGLPPGHLIPLSQDLYHLKTFFICHFSSVRSSFHALEIGQLVCFASNQAKAAAFTQASSTEGNQETIS